MHTPIGRPAVWVCDFKILTSKVVVLPPRPIGPIPEAFISSIISSSSLAISGSGFLSPTFPSNAFLPNYKHKSEVPPIPTPTTVGGQGFPLAFKTDSTTNSFIPSMPSAGSAIFSALLFSDPNPLGNIVISI